MSNFEIRMIYRLFIVDPPTLNLWKFPSELGFLGYLVRSGTSNCDKSCWHRIICSIIWTSQKLQLSCLQCYSRGQHICWSTTSAAFRQVMLFFHFDKKSKKCHFPKNYEQDCRKKIFWCYLHLSIHFTSTN